MLQTWYLVPGLGADERIFASWPARGQVRLCVLQWPAVDPTDSLESYAAKFLPQIDGDRAVYLVGVSYGGAIVAALSHMLDARAVVIVSSAAKSDEVPWLLKKVSAVPGWLLNLAVNKATMKFAGVWVPHVFSLTNESMDTQRAALQMVRQSDIALVRWAVRQLKHWPSVREGVRVYRVHGRRDRVFSFRGVGADLALDGAHFVVYTHGKEIVDWLIPALAEDSSL